MSCTQTIIGISRDCTPSMGGIVKVWIANHIDGGLNPTGNTVAAFENFKAFEVRRESSSMTSTITADPKSHTRFVTSEVSLVFPYMSEEKRSAIEVLIASDMAMVVKDANGKYWYLGADNPVNVSGGTAQTGTAAGDSNNYTLTLQDVSRNLPIQLASFDDE